MALLRHAPLRPPALAAAIAAVALLSVAAPLTAQPLSRGEYEVKSAFLLNFARLTQWPESAFAEPQQALVVGVVGGDGPTLAVERQMKNANIGARPIRVRQISTAEQVAGCHILFVTTAEAGRGQEMLRAIRGASVLTVGEAEGFARSGGIINFLTKDNKVRFAINRQVAESAGLRISSRLLRLAKLVSSEDDRP